MTCDFLQATTYWYNRLRPRFDRTKTRLRHRIHKAKTRGLRPWLDSVKTSYRRVSARRTAQNRANRKKLKVAHKTVLQYVVTQAKTIGQILKPSLTQTGFEPRTDLKVTKARLHLPLRHLDVHKKRTGIQPINTNNPTKEMKLFTRTGCRAPWCALYHLDGG